METNKSVLSLAHYRSKKRVRDLGEVFTPKKYVHQMLDTLDKSIWADVNKVFFEPTCGHGNFVIAIVERRLEAFLYKAKKNNINNSHFYAVANTLNNLWAIDVDSKNINFCRDRVWDIILRFLLENEKSRTRISEIISKNKKFFAHILCCINWQIHENEALSCLEKDSNIAQKVASKTIVSKKWFSKNGHKPINFQLPWCEFFRIFERNNITLVEYKKSLQFFNFSVGRKKSIFVEKFKFKKLNFKYNHYKMGA